MVADFSVKVVKPRVKENHRKSAKEVPEDFITLWHKKKICLHDLVAVGEWSFILSLNLYDF